VSRDGSLLIRVGNKESRLLIRSGSYKSGGEG
jgi:hypothetical protein